MWGKLNFNSHLAVTLNTLQVKCRAFASTAHFQQYIVLSGEGGLGGQNTAAENSGTEGRSKKRQTFETGLTEINR